MLEPMPLIVLIIGLLWLAVGVFSLLFPTRSIGLERRLCRKLKQWLEHRVDAPVRPAKIVWERILGGFFISAGLGLVLFWWWAASLLAGLEGGAERGSVMTVETAMKSVTRPAVETALASSAATQAAQVEILTARYGACGKWVDVTERVQSQVKDGRLCVRASGRLGGDPFIGVRKVLQVDYRVGGQVGRETALDGDLLHIPPFPEQSESWQAIRTPEQLIALAKTCPAEIGFFGKNLATGQTVEHRPDQPFCLASIVKLFVLTEVMHQAEQGQLDLSEWVTVGEGSDAETMRIEPALDAMIRWSDNDATAALAARVGYARVNALPGQLGLTGFATEVLPAPGVLTGVLDERINSPRLLAQSELPPQHGTSRGFVGFLEGLSQGKVVDARVNRRVLDVLERNPMNVAGRAAGIDCMSVGKGGSIGWYRPPRTPYNMIGWAAMVYDQDPRRSVAFCVLCEWLPDKTSDVEKNRWCSALSDCIVSLLQTPSPAAGLRGSAISDQADFAQ